MLFHFVDYFLCYVEAFEFDIVPVFYSDFVACDFGHIYEIITKTNVKKVFPWFLWGVFQTQFCVQISLTNGILFGLKIEANPAIWDNMDKHTDINISEISQLQKDKYWMIMTFSNYSNLQKQSRMDGICQGLGGGEWEIVSQ